MTSTNGALILKTDGLGRVRTPRVKRETILNEFERSGLSGIKFAQLIGVKYPTFASWVQKRRRMERKGNGASDSGGNSEVRWLEATVDRAAVSSVPGTGLVVQLPGGAKVELGNSVQVALAAELLQLLERGQSGAC